MRNKNSFQMVRPPEASDMQWGAYFLEEEQKLVNGLGDLVFDIVSVKRSVRIDL